MHIIRSSSPQEAVLAWLQAELTSGRFQNDLRESLKNFKATESIVTNPRLDDKHENELGYKILKNYRDWFKDDIDNYDWLVVDLDIKDVRELEYIDYSYWNELSNDTHKVRVAADNIHNGKIVFEVLNDNFWSVAKAIDLGEQFAPIVILKDDPDSPSRIVEGHVRATAYALADKPPKLLPAIQGIARS